jgi:Flp pilus assembly protein TadD
MAKTSTVQKPVSKNHPLFDQAFTLHRQGKVDEAVQCYRQLLREKPDEMSAWLNLGTIMRQRENFNAALACAGRAMELSPGNTSCMTNYANCLVDLDRGEEALAIHAEAVKIKPGDIRLHNNYAIALRDFNRYEEALEQFNLALKIEPNNTNIAWDRAITYLHLQDYKRGWDAFEIRWKHKDLPERKFTVPRWSGEDLTGKTILVHEEQGFGDTILCTRYLPLVAARGGRLIFECKKPLHRLFSKIPGVAKISEPFKSDESFDYHVPMMSLPGIFGTDLSNIPPVAPMFVPDAVPEGAQKLLDMGKGRFRVGIVWSGSPTFSRNRKRAVSIERFLPFAEIPGVQLYGLQKGHGQKEIEEFGADPLILDIGPHVNDFADTAAVLQQLDLVIMTDSSVAHLASSVGKPVWNMLCYFPYWLYLHDREDSPWYAAMKLIRQPKAGDWDSVFERVKKDLAQAVELKKNGKWPSHIKDRKG